MKSKNWVYILIGLLLLIIASFFIWNTRVHIGDGLGECGIENCHGNIVCGPNVVEICDEMYSEGDICRQYESCKVVDGQCTVERAPEFYSCESGSKIDG